VLGIYDDHESLNNVRWLLLLLFLHVMFEISSIIFFPLPLRHFLPASSTLILNLPPIDDAHADVDADVIFVIFALCNFSVLFSM
jgi:hypothetical protein